MAWKKFCIAVCLFCSATALSAQQKTDTAFQKEWLEIDTLIVARNLTKSALTKVETIYGRARQQNLYPQVIKALIYRYSLQNEVEENASLKKFSSLEKDISQATDPVQKSVLHALAAKYLNQYFNNQRWVIYNRKSTENYTHADLSTWSAADFEKAIARHFIASLEPHAALLRTNVQHYAPALIKGSNISARPTLYDVIVHEALYYFTSAAAFSRNALPAFLVSDPALLADYRQFATTRFSVKDTTLPDYKALLLYQQLILAHLDDADKTALAYADIERIQWAYEHAGFNYKEDRYVQALKNAAATYGSHPAAANAWYMLAVYENDKGYRYTPFGDSTNRYAHVRARQIIERAVPLFDKKTEGVINMQNLLLQINRKELSTETEQVNLPGLPFRALVSYRNISTLYGRIVKLDDNDAIRNKYWLDGYWKKITELPVYKTFTQPLPATNDHQRHATEIRVDGLPSGNYAIIGSSDAAFSDTASKLSMQFFSVSNIAYIRNGNDFFVADRQTGAPLADVTVTISKGIYNNKAQMVVFQPYATRKTDKNGFFKFAGKERDGSFRYTFVKDKEKLDLRENDYIVYENDTENETEENIKRLEKNNSRVYFFTDRSIYRPGQTVQFKGIAVTRDRANGQSKLIETLDSAWVYLKDANRKKIDSLRYALNSYGSFSGRFSIPQNLLTGQFSIEAGGFNQSATYFSVEEYKRPTFNIAFDKPKGSYRLNDSITVNGTATAYAGNKIGNAKVIYTVTRNARALYPWLRTMPLPAREISHGELVTDADGRFSIPFAALADDITDRSGEPVFSFTVKADITDAGGETRSSTTSIRIGYTSLLLTVNTPVIADADSLKKLSVSVTNLAGEKEPALVNIRFSQLQAPDKTLRKRYWQRPDQFSMTRSEFERYFPNDEYEHETDYTTWKVAGNAGEYTVNTKETEQFNVAGLQPGTYKVESITRDKYGDTVKDIRYMQLFQASTGKFPVPGVDFSYNIKDVVQPGEKAVFLTGSNVNKLYVIRKTTKPSDTKGSYSYLERPKGTEQLVYTPGENDRGGVVIDEAYIYNNRLYTHQYYVNVPWSNKDLKVTYTSYRNKTEPGSQEKWTVSVKGNKDSMVNAELLTSMYDASLDQFRQNSWSVPLLWKTTTASGLFSGSNNFNSVNSNENYIDLHLLDLPVNTYYQLATDIAQLLMDNDKLKKYSRYYELAQAYSMGRSDGMLNEVVTVGYGVSKTASRVVLRGAASTSPANAPLMFLNGKVAGMESVNPDDVKDVSVLNAENATALYGSAGANGAVIITTKPAASEPVTPRTNLNETAFFLPHLYTDSSGNYNFSFTIPEALTEWKWMSFAHTKDLAMGTATASVITQKTLMVRPGMPRFLREGDNIELSTRIVNTGESELTGQVTLELLDAATLKPVDGWFQNMFPVQYFTVGAGKTSALKFPVQVPFSFNKPLIWRFVARAGNFSDGEENIIPVVTNRTLVTESLPLYVNKDTTKTFRFDKLLNNSSETLTHEALTVEFTGNPVWYAVQSLPYLINYPYECAEQTFNRFYANTLAAYIVNSNPAIKIVFEAWKKDTSSLKSNLEKNQELKQLLLQETPWVMNAVSESEQRRNIARLFDMAALNSQSDLFIRKLQDQQFPGGAFSWFKGGGEDRYITNYILTGIGKLKRLGALTPDLALRMQNLIGNAVNYLDGRIATDYFNRMAASKISTSQQTISTTEIQYLYMRSFFGNIQQSAASKTAFSYYYELGKKTWNTQNLYNKAMLGIVYLKNNEKKFVNNYILPAVLENSVTDAAKNSVYWKNRQTCFWYESPVEHQSMMIAFLQEMQQNQPQKNITDKITAARTWLLLNKQTNNWKTTVATADACYALLSGNESWLNNSRKVSITLGNYTINSQEKPAEAGSGYFKERIDGKNVTPQMGNVTVTVSSAGNKNSQPAWGSVYWQYFENLDKITTAGGPLSITKKLFLEKNTDKGKVLTALEENAEVKVGDKIVVRMEIRSDRDMDYVHLKDMRAAAMEPVNVLSGYKWQDGLGYYESTKDASSNFFISNLRKGTYVFEYPVFITHSGVFSAGIANIQCMYAPEFTAHSNGITLRVVN